MSDQEDENSIMDQDPPSDHSLPIQDHDDDEDEDDEDDEDLIDERPKRPKSAGRQKSKTKRIRKSIDSTPAVSDELTDQDDDFNEETDEKGETKVNKDGYLLGGREYRFQTFTLPRHPTRLYLFSLDASKLLGFRDTYIFFLRNSNIKRINGTEEDRERLKELNILPSSLRNRPVTLVRARNLFKIFGHKVVRRGRPVRDDYFVGDLDESTYNEETKVDEDEQTFGIYDYTKSISGVDDGPFRRHATSVVGFNKPKRFEYEPLEPLHVPKALENDSWMLKCALSAAEFNHRLIFNRPTSFLDLHTNVEQVPKINQSDRILVEMSSKDSGNTLVIDTDVVVNREPSSEWTVVSDSAHPTLYPIAVMRDQYQDTLSLYPYRFQPTEEGTEAKENDNPNKPNRPTPYDLPANLLGVVPFKPLVPVTPSISSRQKRSRSKVNGTESAGGTSLCVHCRQKQAPTPGHGIPPTLTLDCVKCESKQHPSCVDFKDDVLISKCLTYDWHCALCKVCTICNDSGHDGKLVFCDVCDRGTHTFCMSPPLDELPDGVWLCTKCSVCQSCKVADPGQSEWCHVIVPSATPPTLGNFLCTLCSTCHQEFVHDRFCPLCIGVYTEEADELAMVCCDQCERWIHVGCDPELTEERYEELVKSEDPKYTCLLCEPRRLDRAVNAKRDGKYQVVVYKGLTIVAPPLVRRK
ncbi:chromatin remodelling complex Rsc7/Swp82 subunit-domain-containing protein [Globomyces pollinis-pini]|nr:chromatin remodelling complex Rsc7/Swp82 subunit-domain-containing protein [Globomyces pollinis-pini]